MAMQDVDFELVYEPGKDAADPLDFLSRHPLPQTGKDKTDCIVKMTMTVDNDAIVLDRIRDETHSDTQLQNVIQRHLKGDWEDRRKDPDINPFYSVRDSLYVLDNLLMRDHQVVLPDAMQRKVIESAHGLGHFGVSRTKSMLRERYWFPRLNEMVESILGQCFECTVTTKNHRREPVKSTPIQESRGT